MANNIDFSIPENWILEFLFRNILDEFDRALKLHGNYNSLHEAIAIIREEYLELEKEIFKKKLDTKKVYKEALHLTQTGFKLMKYIKELE